MEPAAIEDAVQEVANALSFLPGWAVAAIVLALAVVASLAVHGVLARLTRRAFANRPGVISLTARTRALTRLAFVTIALALVLPAIDLPPRAAALFATALPFCFVVLLGWIALIAVDIGVNMYLMRFRLDADDNLLARKHVTQMRVLRRVISTVVILITAGAALMTIGAVRQVGVSLFASAGVAGLVGRPRGPPGARQPDRRHAARHDPADPHRGRGDRRERVGLDRGDHLDLRGGAAVGSAPHDRAALLFHGEAVPELDPRGLRHHRRGAALSRLHGADRGDPRQGRGDRRRLQAVGPQGGQHCRSPTPRSASSRCACW